jgi:serine/threonine protein kinase
MSLDRLTAALSDRYRLERELGQGGMATVYLAQDLRHDRQVALKVLKPELAAVIGAERFLQEIRTTANLQHPHILPLHDSGQVDFTVLFFGVTAESVLRLVAGLLAKHQLDAVLIGNAAAALRGSPVTTVDLDFMFRKTPANLRKVRRLADDLDAVVFLPYYRASELYRVVRDRDGLQLDFMAKIDGIRSFEGLRARASAAEFGKHELLVAALEDIIRSKQAANRPQDRAVLPLLRRTLREAR